MKKQILSFFLTFVLIAGITPANILNVGAETSFIYVGGVKLNDGEYLVANGETATSTQPTDNYAYYNDGELILHNFEHKYGYKYNDEDKAIVYYDGDLDIVLEGENSFVNAGNDTFTVIKTTGDMTVVGTGSLNIETTSIGLESGEECFITVDGVGLIIKAGKEGIPADYYSAILCGSYAISNSTITIDSKGDGISTNDIYSTREGDNYIKNSTITITAKEAGLGDNKKNSRDTVIEDSTVVINANLGMKTNEGALTIVNSNMKIKTTEDAALYLGDFSFGGYSKLNVIDSVLKIEGGYTIVDSFLIEDSSVTIDSRSDGIDAHGGESIIKRSDVTINAESYGFNYVMTGNPSLTIADSTVEINSKSTGVCTHRGKVSITNSKVSIVSGDTENNINRNGIEANSAISIIGSEVDISATACAIIGNTVSIIGSEVTANATNTAPLFENNFCAIKTNTLDLGPAIILASTEPNGINFIDFVEEDLESYDLIIIKGEVEKGDANVDGSIDNLDASAILKYDAGIINLSKPIIDAIDVNGDGYVDNLDATMVLKYDAGLIDKL